MKKDIDLKAIKKEFYYSKQWRKISKAFKISKNYTCENCGNRFINNDCGLTIEQQLQVHHKNPVTIEKILNGDMSLYDFDNLELLCIKCHNAERSGSVCAPGYKLVNGRMKKYENRKN